MQIYKCMINRYIDKHGSIREYIGYIHQNKDILKEYNYE